MSLAPGIASVLSNIADWKINAARLSGSARLGSISWPEDLIDNASALSIYSAE